MKDIEVWQFALSTHFRQCTYLELKAVLFNTCSVKQPTVCRHKKSKMFLITELTQGMMGNGIREEASFPLSLLTLFSPLLAFPHSGTPPSASPPLHRLPTPPLSRRERKREERDRGRKV